MITPASANVMLDVIKGHIRERIDARMKIEVEDPNTPTPSYEALGKCNAQVNEDFRLMIKTLDESDSVLWRKELYKLLLVIYKEMQQ